MKEYVPRPLVQALVILSLCLPLGFANAGTTVKTNKLVFDGLELHDLECTLQGSPKTPSIGPISKAIAAQKATLESCDREGGSYRVGLKWKAGKVRAAKVRKAANRKSKRCITKSLRLINPALEGSCRVTIVLQKTAEPEAPKPVIKPGTKVTPKPQVTPKDKAASKPETKPAPQPEKKPDSKPSPAPKPKTPSK